jgi:hypothetical protein
MGEQFSLTEAATCKTLAEFGLAQAAALSPDGRLVAVACADGQVHFQDALEHKARGKLALGTSRIRSLKFSPDGTRLLTCGEDGLVTIWDARPFRAPPAVVELQGAALDALWARLAGDDAGAGRNAVAQLAASPTSAVPFLRERLRPVPEADPRRVAALIRDLDSEDFDVREKATSELARLGETAAALLEAAARDSPAVEVRRRAGDLVRRLTWRFPLAGESLRLVRAVEVLERAGTAEARQLLAALAGGARGARLTREAAAAVERLAR